MTANGGWHPAVAGAEPSQRADHNTEAPLFEGVYQDRFEKILSRYPTKRAALLPVLHLAQEVRGWISPDTMQRVAELLELTPAQVYATASFYTMYNLQRVGRYLVQVCTNIACDLCGAERVLERFLEATGTRPGDVSADGRFTVVETECLGACGFPTAVFINERFYESVTPEKVRSILDELP